MNKEGLFSELIGERITALYRVAVTNKRFESDSIELSDTLVFGLESNRLLEFMVEQASSYLVSLSNKSQLIPSFELDENEVCQLVALNNQDSILRFPIVVTSVTEWWVGGTQDSEFLVGVVLWGPRQTPLMSMCTEGDDIEQMTYSEMKTLLERMTLDYPKLEEFSYSSRLEHRLVA